MGDNDRQEFAERTFPGQLDQLAAVSAFVLDAARDCGLDDRDLFAIQMAVDEAATNVIVHGYEDSGLEGDLRILCWKQGGSFVVQMRDAGPPFDPGQIPEPNLQTPLEDRQEGGLGVFLMRRLMDEVQFTREGEENVLTMVRRCARSSLPSGISVVTPAGRIDATRSAELEQALRAPLQSGSSSLLVDLAKVSYLSSGGLRALLVVAKELGKRGGGLVLCCPQPSVARVLHIAGFSKIFALHDTREAAIGALEDSRGSG